MRASELNHLVAVATGERISAIRRLGFSLVDECRESEPDVIDFGPQVVDWDEIEVERERQLFGGEIHDPAAA